MTTATRLELALADPPFKIATHAAAARTPKLAYTATDNIPIFLSLLATIVPPSSRTHTESVIPLYDRRFAWRERGKGLSATSRLLHPDFGQDIHQTAFLKPVLRERGISLVRRYRPGAGRPCMDADASGNLAAAQTRRWPPRGAATVLISSSGTNQSGRSAGVRGRQSSHVGGAGLASSHDVCGGSQRGRQNSGAMSNGIDTVEAPRGVRDTESQGV